MRRWRLIGMWWLGSSRQGREDDLDRELRSHLDLEAEEQQQLVQFTYTLPANGPENWNGWFGYPHLERFRTQAGTLSGIFGGVGLNRVNVGWHGSAGLAQCDAYTDNFFSVMGVAPQGGR